MIYILLNYTPSINNPTIPIHAYIPLAIKYKENIKCRQPAHAEATPYLHRPNPILLHIYFILYEGMEGN